MNLQDMYYRRNLPHYHLQGYPLFITFRLFGSLPLDILSRLKRQRAFEMQALKKENMAEQTDVEGKYFERFDNWLDQCEFGPRWLQVDNIAQMVAEGISKFNGDRYRLMTCCIMPNHVHLLIESFASESAIHRGRSARYPVIDTLRLLKGSTARVCNLELNRTGSFWQHESYDHVIRDEQELQRTFQYILNNPVKAGLVKESHDWKFSYVNPQFDGEQEQ